MRQGSLANVLAVLLVAAFGLLLLFEAAGITGLLHMTDFNDCMSGCHQDARACFYRYGRDADSRRACALAYDDCADACEARLHSLSRPTGMAHGACEAYCTDAFDTCHAAAHGDVRLQQACYQDFRGCMAACRATA